jgi:hypothetical protein
MAGAGATIFSKNRADFIRRFPDIAAAVVGLGKREVRRVECNNPAFGFQRLAELEFEAQLAEDAKRARIKPSAR